MSIPTTFNPWGTGGNSISFIRYPEYNRFDITVSSGGAPTLEAGKSYAIALRNDGVKVLASMAYSYDTTPAQS